MADTTVQRRQTPRDSNDWTITLVRAGETLDELAHHLRVCGRQN